MKEQKKLAVAFLAAAIMLILILDPKTAAAGANAGIDISIQTLIPALFPFFFLSSIMTTGFSGISLKFLNPVFRLCGIPRGAECLFLTGILGGYPVGAKAVADANCNNSITLESAQRILALCNNAGPSFIFGIIGSMFDSHLIPLIIWGIQIVSALFTAIFNNRKVLNKCEIQPCRTQTVSQMMLDCLKAIGSVCGWVILFRILISFLDRWVFIALPSESRVLVIGFLELANGCLNLKEIESVPLRFLFANILLSVGGICVTLQTFSVSGKVFSTKYYFLNKGIQCLMSTLISVATLMFLFPVNISKWLIVISCLAFGAVILISIHKLSKKGVAFRKFI